MLLKRAARKTITGSLLAASLTAGALMTLPSASATPTFLGSDNISHTGAFPQDAKIVMSEDGHAAASWVRSVNGTDVVQASYFTGGPTGYWTFPDTITDDSDDVVASNVAINDKGEAVVTWLHQDLSGDWRVAASRYIGQGKFDGMQLISSDTQQSAMSNYSVTMDGTGKVLVAHQDSDGNSLNKIRVSTLTKAGDIASKSLSDSTSIDPAIAANNAGDVVVAWRDQEAGPDTTGIVRFTAASQTWKTLNNPSLGGSFGESETDVAISDNGSATVATTRFEAGNHYRVAATKVNSEGFVSPTTLVSPEDRSANDISLDQNDDGTAFIAWNETGNGVRVGYASRPQTSDWGQPALLADQLSGPTAPAASISDSGLTFISYVDAGHLVAAYRTTPNGLISNYDSGDQNFSTYSAQAGVDNQGNALLGGVIENGGNSNALHGAFLDVAGAVATVTSVGSGATTLGTKLDVSWTAADRFSGLGTGNVRVRSAAWNGGFGSYAYPFVNTAEKKVSFAGTAGRTYCFEAQARDSLANIGKYSAPKCTTVPVDDRTLTAKKFKRINSSSAFLGTASKATKKGAKLTLANVHAKRIALVVTKTEKAGKIKVIFAGKKIGTYSLKGSGSKQVINVKDFGSVKTGTLVIKVISKSGKAVKIDGVVLAK